MKSLGKLKLSILLWIIPFIQSFAQDNAKIQIIGGDYVSDTPADPHLTFNVNHSTCSWNNNGKDSNGDSYNPDEKLIMSYTHPACMSYFSNGQGERMRTAIETIPFLQNVVVSCSKNQVTGRTISHDEVISGCEIEVNNVTIQNRADVIINASNSVKIKRIFEIKCGSTLEVK